MDLLREIQRHCFACNILCNIEKLVEVQAMLAFLYLVFDVSKLSLMMIMNCFWNWHSINMALKRGQQKQIEKKNTVQY